MQAARTRGFTLIEVLAALLIVALGMLGVIQAVTQTARNGTYLREKTLAHWVAMNVITERRLMPDPPAVAESSDEVELAGQRWRWSMTVTQTAVESLRRMDVEVRPADRPESEPLTIVTGFYGTAIGPAGGGALNWADSGTGSGSGDDTDGGGSEGEGSEGEGNGNAGDGGSNSQQGTPTRPTRPPDSSDED